jgi:hypothetical protein
VLLATAVHWVALGQETDAKPRLAPIWVTTGAVARAVGLKVSASPWLSTAVHWVALVHATDSSV